MAPFRKNEIHPSKRARRLFRKNEIGGDSVAHSKWLRFVKSSHVEQGVEQAIEEDVEQDVATGARVIAR
jgi:hypothetical protein